MALDSLVGAGLKDSPYEELSAKYSVLGRVCDKLGKKNAELTNKVAQLEGRVIEAHGARSNAEHRYMALWTEYQAYKNATAAGVGTEATTPAVTG